MIQVLVQQKLVAQIRKARNGNGGWRKDVSILRDKVLRAIIFAHRKAGYVGAHGRKRIGCRAAAIHITEIQSVRARKIVIQAQSELIVILAKGLRGYESVCAVVGQGEKRQDIRRNWINGSENSH